MLAALCVAAGCTHSVSKTALTGDLPSLKAQLAEAERKGEIDRDLTLGLARAVLERELASLADPITAFPETRSCAKQVQKSLERLAQGSGEAAELALLALMEAGLPVPSGSGAELLLAAHGAVGGPAGPRRRAFMLHADAAVRSAALWAAVDSRDAGDVASLLEAARLDPDPGARVSALRALGAIGGASVVLGLRDLWASVDAPRRSAIILAWSSPACLESGGEAELTRLAELSLDQHAVEAALVLERTEKGPPGLSTSVLGRALEGDDVSARLRAVYAAPWSNAELRPSLERAVQSADAATRVLGLLRAIENGTIDAAGITELRKLAADPALRSALVARVVLARAGDASVVVALRADLAATPADQRTLAALGLALLEQWPAAAHALADDSPRVRQVVACQLLGAGDQTEPGTARLRARAFGPFAPEIATFLLAAVPAKN